MPLRFWPRRPAAEDVAPNKPPADQYDPLGQGQQRRRGLFGRTFDFDGDGRVNWQRAMQVMGASMQGGDQLNAFLGAERDEALNRDLFNMRAREQKLEERDTEEQRAAREAAYAALPENLRPLGPVLTPEALSRAVMPPTPEWERIPAGELPRGARFGQRNRETGQEDLDWAPRESSGVNIQMPATAVSRLAEQYVTTGVLPPGISRNPRLAAQVYAEADAIAAAQGITPQDQAWRGANYQANNQGLRALQRQRTLVQSFERTALSNLELAQRLSRQLARTDYPLVNRALMTGQLQSGNTLVAQYVNALIGARTEYAKVLSGATGAAGLTDSAREEAEVLFSQYASPDQFDALVDVARQEMRNRIVAFDDQESYLREQMTGAPPAEEAHAPPVSPPPAPASPAAPRVGEVRRGYRFRGGDPSQQSNWERVR